MIKTPEALVFQAFGIFETLGSKISHGTSKEFAGVRYHLRKVSSKSLYPQKKHLENEQSAKSGIMKPRRRLWKHLKKQTLILLSIASLLLVGLAVFAHIHKKEEKPSYSNLNSKASLNEVRSILSKHLEKGECG